jgi:hypothetical protein
MWRQIAVVSSGPDAVDAADDRAIVEAAVVEAVIADDGREILAAGMLVDRSAFFLVMPESVRRRLRTAFRKCDPDPVVGVLISVAGIGVTIDPAPCCFV